MSTFTAWENAILELQIKVFFHFRLHLVRTLIVGTELEPCQEIYLNIYKQIETALFRILSDDRK